MFGALVIDAFEEGQIPKIFVNKSHHSELEPRRVITGTQEDFDLIVAFDRTIVLIEAQGVGQWNEAQLRSKHQRMCDWDHYYNGLTERYKDAIRSDYRPPNIHLVMTSPNQPSNSFLNAFPKFYRHMPNGRKELNFMNLQILNETSDFLAPERCMDVNGKPKPSSQGESLHLRKINALKYVPEN